MCFLVCVLFAFFVRVFYSFFVVSTIVVVFPFVQMCFYNGFAVFGVLLA